VFGETLENQDEIIKELNKVIRPYTNEIYTPPKKKMEIRLHHELKLQCKSCFSTNITDEPEAYQCLDCGCLILFSNFLKYDKKTYNRKLYIKKYINRYYNINDFDIRLIKDNINKYDNLYDCIHSLKMKHLYKDINLITLILNNVDYSLFKDILIEEFTIIEEAYDKVIKVNINFLNVYYIFAQIIHRQLGYKTYDVFKKNDNENKNDIFRKICIILKWPIINIYYNT
jgi:hypothetical protein